MANFTHESAHSPSPDLPAELLNTILEYTVNVCMSRESVLALLIVSKSFYDIVQPIVYKVHGEAALQHVITNTT
jgi:hypothetical protein